MMTGKEMQTQERIDYIDVFRSFGILAMVMGHVGFGSVFDFFIHAFHMPMFFWISGFLFRHKSKEELPFRVFLIKKARSLLLPYFVFGIAHYLLYAGLRAVTRMPIGVAPLLHLFWTNTEGLAICGALWFLTALFFTDILWFLIDRYIAGSARKTAVVILMALFGNLAGAILPFPLPFALGASFSGIGLYYVGYLFRENAGKRMVHAIMNLSWVSNTVLGLITGILIFLNGYINMRSGKYGMIPLFWVNAVLAIIVGLNYAKLVYPHIQNGWVGKWLTGIGRDSIVYVCLNQVVIELLGAAVKRLGLPVYLSAILILVMSLALLYGISKLFSNTPLKLLIGRR